MSRRIVVVGAGAAGTTASVEARRNDRLADIYLITKENDPEYSRCGLPYAFSGIIPRIETLIAHPAHFYESTNRIRLLLRTECTKLRPDDKKVETTDLETGRKKELAYDALIVATGAEPTRPPIRGIDKPGVFTIRTLDDIRDLSKYVETHRKSVAIIGAGLIGMEMSEAFASKGFEVTVVEMLPEILPATLDPDMASIVRKRAEERGIRIVCSCTVNEISGTSHVEGVVTDRETISVDSVIVAARVTPVVEPWREAGVRTGGGGGISVDDRMSTNLVDVYAAGDCVETTSVITGKHLLLQLATTAVRQGIVAGTNSAGGSDRYSPSTGVATSRLFGLEIACAGLTTEASTHFGLSPMSARVSARTRLQYMPDGTEATAKLLCDSRDGRLIGAQVIGEEDSSWRANFASLAMHLRLTVHEFRRKETCYAPPISPVWDPLTLAALALERKLQAVITTK